MLSESNERLGPLRSMETQIEEEAEQSSSATDPGDDGGVAGGGPPTGTAQVFPLFLVQPVA